MGTNQRIWLTSAALDLSDFNWHHFVLRKTGVGATNVQVFVDGQQIAMTIKDNDLGTTQSFTNVSFGSSPGVGQPITGYLDEFAVWARGLHDREIRDLYKRGVNQVKFQVRSCDDSVCNGETWLGPDGTANTYFTEEHNCTSIDGSGLCSGLANITPPLGLI